MQCSRLPVRCGDFCDNFSMGYVADAMSTTYSQLQASSTMPNTSLTNAG